MKLVLGQPSMIFGDGVSGSVIRLSVLLRTGSTCSFQINLCKSDSYGPLPRRCCARLASLIHFSLLCVLDSNPLYYSTQTEIRPLEILICRARANVSCPGCLFLMETCFRTLAGYRPTMERPRHYKDLASLNQILADRAQKGPCVDEDDRRLL